MSKEIHDNIERVSVNKIFKNHWNPNEMAPDLFEKERNSIREFGFLVPLLVRKVANGFEVIDGEHRLRAAIEEGYEDLPVNNLGKITDEKAKQLTMILNMHGEARRDKLSALIADLTKTVDIEELIQNLPMKEAEIRNMLDQAPIDWDKLSVEAPPLGAMAAGSDSLGSGAGVDPKANESTNPNNDNLSINISVLKKTHSLFFEQVDRVNALLVPEAPPKNCAPGPALQVMLEIVKMTDIEAFLKARKRPNRAKPASKVRQK